MKTIKWRALALSGFLLGCLAAGTPVLAQDIGDTSVPLDENLLFGGDKDIVQVIDTDVASKSVVELVAETKTYPVFLVEGSGSVGLTGGFSPVGATPADDAAIDGSVKLGNFSLTFLPNANTTFGLSASGTMQSSGNQEFEAGLTADIRASEFSRLYVSADFDYSYDAGDDATVGEFGVEEMFLDTAIDRTLFFRLGKQRISWGVGNWFQPADVLSLAAIDPDDPTASREGPFAFKVDLPFGLNHATLYVTPPMAEGDIHVSAAQRVDFVVGGFELSLGGFARSDMEAKPRLMFMFTGTLGDFDLYGENVAAWGSDRTYVKAVSGGYESYTVDDIPVFQSTIGAKYSWSNSEGLSLSAHLQGYYNGTGYADSTILLDSGAIAVLKADPAYAKSDTAQAGMFYLAGSGSLSLDFGEDDSSSSLSLSGSALYNFSDGSLRVNPTLGLDLGSSRDFSVTLSALTSIGEVGSEYASKGNAITPKLSVRAFDDLSASVSVPVVLGSDFTPDEVDVDFSLMWNVVSFDT